MIILQDGLRTTTIPKTRNYIKYYQTMYKEAILITNLKNELRMVIKVRNFYDIMILRLPATSTYNRLSHGFL